MALSKVEESSGTVLEPSAGNVGTYAVYAVIAGLSALFPFAGRTSHVLLASGLYLLLVLVPVGFLLFGVRSALARRLLAQPVFWFVCLAFLGWYGESHFLHLVLPRPNELTAAPALMLPARNLLHGVDPYAVQLAGHAPVSPGPGWILLLAPITLANGAGLLTFLGVLLVSLLLAMSSRVSAGVFLLLTMLQPDLLWTSIWGTDLFLIPLAFAALCLMVDRWYQNPVAIYALGILAGIFAQSRFPIAILVVLLVLGLWRKDRSAAVRFAVVAALVCCALYAGFFLWTVQDHLYFQPLHLLHRARRSGLLPSVIGPLCAACVLIWAYFYVTSRVGTWLLASAALTLLLFAPTGLGELAKHWKDLGGWEGANYLSFGLSLLVTYLALRTQRVASAG